MKTIPITFPYNGYECKFPLRIPESFYHFAASRPFREGEDPSRELQHYVRDDASDIIALTVWNKLEDLLGKVGIDLEEENEIGKAVYRADIASALVRAIPFQDSPASCRPLFPIETLYQYGGMLADKAILLLNLLEMSGYSSTIWKFDNVGLNDIMPAMNLTLNGVEGYLPLPVIGNDKFGYLPQGYKGMTPESLSVEKRGNILLEDAHADWEPVVDGALCMVRYNLYNLGSDAADLFLTTESYSGKERVCGQTKAIRLAVDEIYEDRIGILVPTGSAHAVPCVKVCVKSESADCTKAHYIFEPPVLRAA